MKHYVSDRPKKETQKVVKEITESEGVEITGMRGGEGHTSKAEFPRARLHGG